MYNYDDRDGVTMYNRILEYIGQALTLIFVLECLIKVVGYGFVGHSYAYLRDPWNVLDFVIVLSGYLLFILFILLECLIFSFSLLTLATSFS